MLLEDEITPDREMSELVVAVAENDTPPQLAEASPKYRARQLRSSDLLHDAPVVEQGKATKIRRDEKGAKKINRYVVLDLLGRGAYSKVKLCQHELDGTYYAMKILSRSVLKSRGIGQTSGLQKFKREVAILKRLRHPHIIALQEVIDDPTSEKLYLILELAEGRELVTLDENNAVEPDADGCTQISEGAVQRLASGIIDAVAFAHENGIAHRDIKPQNILLTDRFIPKLSDFGVSAIIDDSPLVTCTEGTIAFLPPELLALASPSSLMFSNSDDESSLSSWQGSFAALPRQPTGTTPVSRAMSSNNCTPVPPLPSPPTPVVDLFKADVWSLALTFYVVVTGHHPWPLARDAPSLYEAITKKPMSQILKEERRKKNPGLSIEMMEFLDGCMRIDPNERLSIFQARDHPWVTGAALTARRWSSPAPEGTISSPPMGSSISSTEKIAAGSLPSRVASAVDLSEADVANALTVGSSRTMSRGTAVLPPTRLCIKRTVRLSRLHFDERDAEGMATSGSLKRSSVERGGFAYDDSCIVNMGHQQIEHALLNQAIAFIRSGGVPSMASPHSTQPPSPNDRGRFEASPDPEHSPQKRGTSPPQIFDLVPPQVLQLNPGVLGSSASGLLSFSSAPNVQHSSPNSSAQTSGVPSPSIGSPNTYGSGPRRSRHQRSLSQPSFSAVTPSSVVEVPAEVTPIRHTTTFAEQRSSSMRVPRGMLDLEAAETHSIDTLLNAMHASWPLGRELPRAQSSGPLEFVVSSPGTNATSQSTGEQKGSEGQPRRDSNPDSMRSNPSLGGSLQLEKERWEEFFRRNGGASNS
jgi:serine/threonine protein kinase